MGRADLGGDTAGRREIARPGDPDGEGMELVDERTGEGREDRGIEAAGEEGADGHVVVALEADSAVVPGPRRELLEVVDPGAKCVHLRGEGEDRGAVGGPTVPVVERLDADRVAGEDEVVGVADRQREHAAQRTRHRGPALLVEVEDGLDVAAGPEDMTVGKLGAKGRVVEDLAVGHDRAAGRLAMERLSAAQGIHDRQAAMAERSVGLAVDPRSVGTAVRERVGHPPDERRIVRSPDPRDPAHRCRPQVPELAHAPPAKLGRAMVGERQPTPERLRDDGPKPVVAACDPERCRGRTIGLEEAGVTISNSDTVGEAPRRRAGGRAGHERHVLPQQRSSTQPRIRITPTEIVSADELESIHVASLRVLRDIGMDFLDEGARDLLKAAGADVEAGSERVRFDPDFVTERITTAPSTFVLHSWNPARDLQMGGDWTAFGAVASAPNAADLDHGRRVGNRADYQNLLRLGQMLNSVHFFGGYAVEPIDLHASIRHLHALHDVLTLSDKPIHAYSLGRQRNLDAIEMVRIARHRR